MKENEIEFINALGVHYKAVVVGNDSEIGITIKKYGDTDHYLYCLNGPLGYKARTGIGLDHIEQYRERYKLVNSMIANGLVDMRTLDKISYVGRAVSVASSSTCSFGQ